jgi:hypothetical protein
MRTSKQTNSVDLALDLVTGLGAARILGMSGTHVLRLMSAGHLQSMGKAGQAFLFRRQDVEELRKARLENPPHIGRPRKNPAPNHRPALRADGRRPK